MYCLAAAIAPEALALAWAREIGAGTVGGGLLLAANPVGSVVGLLVLTRVRPEVARRAMVPLVALALGPLLLAPAVGSLSLLLLLVALSGAGLTLTTIARVRVAAALPDAVRGRAFGVAGTGLDVETVCARAAAVHPDLAEIWAPFAGRFADLVRRRAGVPAVGG